MGSTTSSPCNNIPGDKPELHWQSTVQLAADIRARRVTCVEVMEHFLARVDKHNPEIRAVGNVNRELALAKAKTADDALARNEVWGPLHGVPVGIKDSFETTDFPTTSSFPPLADYIAPADAATVALIRRAGGIIYGKTNLPPLAFDTQCDSPLFGVCRNPYNLSRSTGGSSSGSGAGLAAGFFPLALGSDIGGSIRNPAHSCGVTGIMPTEGQIQGHGHIPEPPGAPKLIHCMARIGPMARNIEDLELAMGILTAPHEYNQVPALAPAVPKALAAMRFLYIEDFGGAIPMDPLYVSQLRSFVDNLTAAGARVDRDEDTLSYQEISNLWCALIASMIGQTAPAKPPLLSSSDDPLNKLLNEHWDKASAANHGFALEGRANLAAKFFKMMSDYDGLLMPVSSTAAMELGKYGLVEVDGGVNIHNVTATCAHNLLGNVIGLPSVAFPIGTVATKSDGRLPVGIQMMGRKYTDMTLLSHAKTITGVLDLQFEAPSEFH